MPEPEDPIYVPHISTQRTQLYCKKCDAIWDQDTLCHVPIPVWLCHIKTIHCPRCGADWKQISFVTNEDRLRETIRAKQNTDERTDA